MAENDIYNNEKQYFRFRDNIDLYLQPPGPSNRRRKYCIKNPDNIQYYKALFTKLEARDTSYIRRLRLSRSLLIVTHVLEKNLLNVTREDIDKAMTFSHTINKTVLSKSNFVRDIKYIWKLLFPERDEKGRPDESLMPYPVRHISARVDKSREKLRGDKLSLDEFEQLVQSFADDPRMQAILTVSLESLARPQELMHRRIKDVELHDNYGKIYISSHGKEGTGFLRIIDSYFYLSQWINKHPLRHKPNAYLFINIGKTKQFCQMTPFGANKLIRKRCQKLGIAKPITLYSLKRNGVTMMRLAGKSDLEIQHTARWTSTKQLRTYDMSNQEESFVEELVRRGKIPAQGKYKDCGPKTKLCSFCNTENGLAETLCATCRRPLDRELIEQQVRDKDSEIQNLNKRLESMEQMFFKALANLNPSVAKSQLSPEQAQKLIELQH